MRIWVSTVFILISLKTEIADLSEDKNYKGPVHAMAEPYLVQKDLVT